MHKPKGGSSAAIFDEIEVRMRSERIASYLFRLDPHPLQFIKKVHKRGSRARRPHTLE